MRPLTASASAGLLAPKFEPPEAAPLFDTVAVAEGRDQKYLGSLKL